MVTVGNSRRETTSVYLTPGLLSTDVGGVRAVSTTEQNPDHQTDALLRAGVGRDDIHVDHASGAKVSRPKLDLILRVLRDEDFMVVGLRGEPGRRRGRPADLGNRTSTALGRGVGALGRGSLNAAIAQWLIRSAKHRAPTPRPKGAGCSVAVASR